MANGKGVQQYKCMACGHQFVGKAPISPEEIWEEYMSGKQTIKELSSRYRISESTIKRRLREVKKTWVQPKYIGHGVIHIDATYFGRNAGIILAIEANRSKFVSIKKIYIFALYVLM